MITPRVRRRALLLIDAMHKASIVQTSIMKEHDSARLIYRIRLLLWLFIMGLAISGATALPLETELRSLTPWVSGDSGLARWLWKVQSGLVETNAKYPFIAYGTDWLAFAHFVIAIAFIGPLRDPIRNIWVIEFGMIACVLVIPFALCMGGFRGIPLGWRLIDCSFGVFGIIPLWMCWRQISLLSQSKAANPIYRE